MYTENLLSQGKRRIQIDGAIEKKEICDYSGISTPQIYQKENKTKMEGDKINKYRDLSRDS